VRGEVYVLVYIYIVELSFLWDTLVVVFLIFTQFFYFVKREAKNDTESLAVSKNFCFSCFAERKVANFNFLYKKVFIICQKCSFPLVEILFPFTNVCLGSRKYQCEIL
jgi:hypothetical protein